MACPAWKKTMSMKLKRTSIFAWILFGMFAIMALFGMIYLFLANRNANLDIFTLTGVLLWGLLPVEFAFLAALILSYQPRNVIGWLLMLPAIALANDRTFETYFSGFASAPADPSLIFQLTLWFYGWSWLLLIFPVFFILLLFPTGRPVSARWRWVTFYILGVGVLFFVMIAFQQSLTRDEITWSVVNPVGFLPKEWVEKYSIAPFLIGLLSSTALSAAAMIARYRRAAALEREQIMWLLYACIFFAVVYIFSITFNLLREEQWGSSIWVLLGPLALMTVPAAIAIAILRYRL